LLSPFSILITCEPVGWRHSIAERRPSLALRRALLILPMHEPRVTPAGTSGEQPAVNGRGPPLRAPVRCMRTVRPWTAILLARLLRERETGTPAPCHTAVPEHRSRAPCKCSSPSSLSRARPRGVTHRCSDDGRVGALEDRRCRPARAPHLPTVPSPSAVTPKSARPGCAPALVAPDAASAQQGGALEKPPTCAFCRRAGRFLRHGPRRSRPRRRRRPRHM
jgi:hypothetical protein